MKTTPKTPNTPRKRQKCRWKRQKWPSRPEVFDAFSEWMAYPIRLRDPRNQQLFATKHEVSPDTLSDYKKKADFWIKVKENKERLKREIEDKRSFGQILDELERNNLK